MGTFDSIMMFLMGHEHKGLVTFQMIVNFCQWAMAIRLIVHWGMTKELWVHCGVTIHVSIKESPAKNGKESRLAHPRPGARRLPEECARLALIQYPELLN